MTSAGTVAAGGVSGIETYVLADGSKNTLTLTPANFAGVTGAITISDGNGGNTIVATSLSLTDGITVYAGTGGDTLDGGKGPAEFVLAAPGKNTFQKFTAADTIGLSNSGFALGQSVGPLPMDLFVADSTGKFTNPSEQRFVYDTKTGDLSYSASGSNTKKDLVVQLTSHPTLSLGQLFVTS
jgi:hypothetical protein